MKQIYEKKCYYHWAIFFFINNSSQTNPIKIDHTKSTFGCKMKWQNDYITLYAVASLDPHPMLRIVHCHSRLTCRSWFMLKHLQSLGSTWFIKMSLQCKPAVSMTDEIRYISSWKIYGILFYHRHWFVWYFENDYVEIMMTHMNDI